MVPQIMKRESIYVACGSKAIDLAACGKDGNFQFFCIYISPDRETKRPLPFGRGLFVLG
jgi:hypothetical protein